MNTKLPDGSYKIIPHTPNFFSPICMEYDYNPAGECPMFQKYLDDVQPKKENQEILQMLAGLSLIPETKYNVFFLLYGEGGTGKSVFSNILAELIGKDNVSSVPMQNFSNKFGMSVFVEKLLNI